VIVKLPYGEDEVALDLRGLRVKPLAPSAPPGSRSVRALVQEAVDRPLEGPPLAELAQGRSSATVIVPDWTRSIPLPEILPAILDRLRRGGIESAATTIVIACGTHPKQDASVLAPLVGDLPKAVAVVQHDCRDAGGLVPAGELRPGVELRLARPAMDCELLVTVGGVRHHYFAGFGGGPKMVFPGVGGYTEIQANHSLVLQRAGGELVRDPRCEPGLLDGNPVAEEIARAAQNRQPDMAVCTVAGRDGGVAWVGAGPWRTAFEAAVKRVREWYELPPRNDFDLMVACGGGRPTDSTLIQAHKGLDAACRFLPDGGEILYVAAMDQGLGSPEMQPFVDDPRHESILASLEDRWVQYGHTTLRVVEKTSRVRVWLHSTLDAAIGTRLGFEPTTDPEAVVQRWRDERPGATVGVMVGAAVFPRA
ncbi:MAG: nickel-dependent lactate racemase, partial [Holophagae bacterium]|jgi:nickel-dependent lactate racemase